ncbi:MAG TPA: arginine--tRNA ligase [Candidatus Paceibacterota bacterium]|nr:arginine--tRNA ligase [Candidatus Paceibacterota bacterium]
MIRGLLENEIKKSLAALGVEAETVNLEHPTDLTHGDYATNVALAYAKKTGQNPRDLALKIAEELSRQSHEYVEKVEIAGPGFINFFLSSKFFAKSVREILEKGDKYGHSIHVSGSKTIVEYTDPNPFKEFHIGHLMSNTIGEAVSRIIEAGGAEVKRACYQGDVGAHVAMAVWGLLKEGGEPSVISVLAKAYAAGARAYKTDESAKAEITEINKKIYDRSDERINQLYDQGRKLSLDYFETIYQRLGTKFDYYFFESIAGPFGAEVVKSNVGPVFTQSDGAVVFRGEDYGLHTRVFINSQGLPTYEAKELGLSKVKHDTYPYDLSIVVTGNEVNEYFKVLLKTMELVFPELAAKTRHVSHGMLRLPTGKMSSRTGDVITAESLLTEVEGLVRKKISDRDLPAQEKDEIARAVSVGAIKYSILKQAAGRDIIFDFEKSLSFEGDSGPYLQYAHTRTASILVKAREAGIGPKVPIETEKNEVIRLAYRFPEVIEEAGKDLSPHVIATYLIQLAAAFSGWYAETKIVDPANPASAERVALAAAVGQVLKNGLGLLGIAAPNKM